MSSAVSGLDRADLAIGYRLVTLGRLALEGDRPVEGSASRPRSLALLALLAAAGDGGIGRDKLVRYLWPGSNTSRGRNSLHQTLHAIRRDLGSDAVIGAPNLRLNPAVVSSDIRDFDAAVSRGAYEEAIALYGGPFLDGFSPGDLPEFEEWVTSERSRLARCYAQVLEAAAVGAAQEGDHRRALERWRALAALDPLSSHAALGVIHAFVAAGNRASALEYGRDYHARVSGELGVPADGAVAALLDRLRNELSAQTARTPGPVPTAEPRDVERGSSPRRLNAVRWAAPLLLFAAVLTAWWSTRPEPGPTSSPGLVAILPFTVAGSPSAEYLSAGLVDLLATNLDGESLRSVDPHALLGWLSDRRISPRTPDEAVPVAARFGAGLFLLGNVVESGGRLHVRAALYQREDPETPILRAAVEGAASDLFGLVDQLTAQLLAGRHQGPGGRLARVAAATTHSVEALKSYLAGEREHRAGHYVEAADAFREAANQDTAFALAYYRLSLTAEWLGQDSIAGWAAEAAYRFRDRLSKHDQMLVSALIARRERGVADAEQLYRTVVDDYPDDVEAWLQLGEVLFHGNPLRGRSATEARPAFEQTVALDPENSEALIHLARIASIEGRRGEVDTLMQRVLALGPSVEVLELRAFRAFALGDRDAWKRVTRELLQHPPDVPPVTALQVAIYLDDVEGAQQFAELLRDRRYSDNVRGLGYRLLARVAAARGQWRLAQAQLDTARQFDRTAALELHSLLAALPFLEVPRSDLLTIRDEIERWPAAMEQPGEAVHSAAHAGLHPYIRLYRLGLLSAQLGDTLPAIRYAAALERASDSSAGRKVAALHTFAQSIRARLALRGGDPAAALAHLDRTRWDMVESIFEAEALDRFTRAELLYALGRHEEALNWYRSIAERATYELVYIAPARRRQAEIHEQAGERRLAAESHRAVIRLWRDADAPLQGAVAEAARRLQTLGP